jgi:hypothetical protein
MHMCGWLECKGSDKHEKECVKCVHTSTYMYIYTYTHTYLRKMWIFALLKNWSSLYTCTHLNACIYACISTHLYMHILMACMHAHAQSAGCRHSNGWRTEFISMHACILTHVCMHICIYIYDTCMCTCKTCWMVWFAPSKNCISLNVCIHIHMYVHAYAHVYAHACPNVCAHVYAHYICTCTTCQMLTFGSSKNCINLNVCIHIHMYVHAYAHVYAHVYAHALPAKCWHLDHRKTASISTYASIFTCTYMHMHMHMHMYMHMHYLPNVDIGIIEKLHQSLTIPFCLCTRFCHVWICMYKY